MKKHYKETGKLKSPNRNILIIYTTLIYKNNNKNRLQILEAKNNK